MVSQIRLGHGEDCHRSHGTPWASKSSAAGGGPTLTSSLISAVCIAVRVICTAAPLLDLRGSGAQSSV